MPTSQILTYGKRTVEAIRPCLAEWLNWAQGEVNFHMTQVLTGHGCFDDYLRRIGREFTTACHHCTAVSDTAHTPWPNARLGWKSAVHSPTL